MAGVWAVSLAYVGSRVNRDWTPHDEGLLAESARRLVAGQLPHRDFSDAYTGMLTAYHAVAFGIGGQSLLTLRLALLVAFALWVPVFYAIVARFLPPLAAGLATLAAVAWSVPNYSASMPSWYNLFLTTAGTWAVIRFLETTSRRWLTVAGLCAGLSILVKIVGIYFVVAVGVFLYWRTLDASATHADDAPAESRRWVRVGLAVAAAILLSLGLLGLVWRGIGSGTVLHFVIPGLAVSAIVAAAGIRSGPTMWRPFWLQLVAFGAGLALPILLFLVPYAAVHAVHALITGVLVQPLRRLVSATLPPPGFREAVRTLPVAAALWIAAMTRGTTRRMLTLGAIPLALAALLLSSHGSLYLDVIDAALATVPVTACAAAILLLSSSPPSSSLSLGRQRAVLVVLVAVFFSFLQYPFAATVYFCYVAPLALLAVIAVTAVISRRGASGVALTLLAFSLCFAVWRMNTRAYLSLDLLWPAPKSQAVLPLPRGGLRISAEDSALYTRLAAALRAHATGGYTLCTPDCPEAYFLANLRNPTRTTFEFLNDSLDDARHTLRAIARHGVTVVAVNRQFRFSPLDTALIGGLRRRYPDSTDIGYFTVRWR